MTDRALRTMTVLCYAFGAAFLGYTIYISLSFAMHAHDILVLSLAVLLPLLLATVLRCRAVTARTKKRRLVRLYLVLCFALYAFILANLLFFGHSTKNTAQPALNLIPFHTLWHYTGMLFEGTISQRTAIEYLLGNLILFAPLGLLLPILFRTLTKGRHFLLVMLFIMLGLKALQYFTGLGQFDIDELLVNLCGAFVAFWLFQTQPMRLLMKKCYLGDST